MHDVNDLPDQASEQAHQEFEERLAKLRPPHDIIWVAEDFGQIVIRDKIEARYFLVFKNWEGDWDKVAMSENLVAELLLT